MARGSYYARQKNEVLKAEVNERIRNINDTFGELTGVGEWLCECSRSDCTTRLTMAPKEYEELRSHPRRFAVLPDHVDPAIETIVRSSDGHVIVEKTGEAGEAAERENPRASG